MLFGLLRRYEPLRDTVDRERQLLVDELIEEGLASDEIVIAINSHPELSALALRADAQTTRDDILLAGMVEEDQLRSFLRRGAWTTAHGAYTWGGDRQAFRAYDRPYIVPVFWLRPLVAWLAGFQLPSVGLLLVTVGATASTVAAQLDWRIGAMVVVVLAVLFITRFCGFIETNPAAYVQDQSGVLRLHKSGAVSQAYMAWRRALLDRGVLSYMRRRVNKALLAHYSTVLSVHDAPGLRHLGDLKYHVPTAAKDELIRRLDGVDGGSFALAGPRGAGKTILLRSICEDIHNTAVPTDLGVVVAAPVDYEPRAFVLYLYAEVCKVVKDHVNRSVRPETRRTTRRGRSDPLLSLARLADEKLYQARFLQSFSAEFSAKGGIKFAELNAKAATSLTEQQLTYPEIVADLRTFLQAVADTVDGRLLIGIDELDRIGSGERARKFLDDIKAVFWVRNCYFLVSVSEDALRAFELAGHGLRDTFDSAFDEVVIVEHLDFDASTALLRARVTGMPLPYHALAYCLSGGLPRELMRAARAIVDQQDPGTEVKIGQVTKRLVADELRRYCRAARLALADTGPDAATAAELLRRLDEGSTATDNGLSAFAIDILDAARECSNKIRSLAEAVAAYARYLAALAAVFTDGLTEETIRRATGTATPVEGRFDTVARARRYLGVNDAFACVLIDGFRKSFAVEN